MNENSSKLLAARPRCGLGVRKSTQIALVVASLVAGILALLNLDRNLHQASSAEIGFGASQHGWPLVYLVREFDSLPNHVRAQRAYDWPWPSVEGETRTWQLGRLLSDVVLALMIVATTFLFAQRIAWQLQAGPARKNPVADSATSDGK